MGNVAVAKSNHIILVKGPVNTALYDLRHGEVFTINPLIAGVQEGGSMSREVLQVLRGYLARHPALSRYEELGNKSSPCHCELKGSHARGGFALGEQSLSYPSRPVGLDFMWLELTQTCNLSCAHCYAGAGANHPHPNPLPSREREFISLNLWKEILTEGARLGAKSVQFTGGEPTLYPGLMDLIEHARSCQYTDIEVFTNATYLKDRLLRQWATLGVKVALSFYSYDPETHDNITRRLGSFWQTVQGIETVLAHKIPVRVAITLMKDNLLHRENTIEFLKGLGLKDGEIQYDYVRPTGRGVAEMAILGKGVGKKVAPFKPPPSSKEGQGTCGERFAQGTCWKGKIAISSEGEVYPCIFARQLPVGKLPEMGLEEVIQGQALQWLWQITLEEVETCRDCELRYGCFDCRALAQTTTGDLLSRNPHCQYNPYTGLMERNGGQRMKERPKRRSDTINEVIEDETVIYDPKNHNVHHLNPIASVIWEYCDGNHTAKEITEEIVKVLEAAHVQVEGDVTKTIEEFQGKGLLEEVLK
jgi:radical SAM protein with 4Fe4S-binding SPASM domain